MENTGEGEAFPEANAAGEELNPGQQNKNLQVDPVSSNVAASLELQKEESEATEKAKKEKEKKDGMEALKTTIIVSGIIVAVVGAVYAITKKLREN